MTEKNALRRQSDERRKAFRETYGYPAHLIPDIWVGQLVALNTLGGTSPGITNGRLEAVTHSGFVLSNESGRLFYIPNEAVIQVVLHEDDDPAG